LLGNGWFETPRSSVKLIGLLSSLPAQAASAIGNIRIAANFADVVKPSPSVCPEARFLDRSAAKWNSHLGQSLAVQDSVTAPVTAPTHGHWGSNGAWVGLVSVGCRGGAMWI